MQKYQLRGTFDITVFAEPVDSHRREGDAAQAAVDGEDDPTGAKEELALESAVQRGLEGNVGGQFDDIELDDIVTPAVIEENGQ
jgi:hypothetical protein